MPLQSRFPNHPIRLLRRRLNLTGAEFAKIIGTSVDTIVSLENDRLPISSKLARRISFITGADYKQLLKGADGKLVASKGRAYKGAEYKKRQRRLKDASVLKALSEQLASKAGMVLRKSPRNVAQVYCDILDAIESAAERKY
jgi:DNA-binding XRE family transcriptional regulator